jgi:hypothetical protein
LRSESPIKLHPGEADGLRAGESLALEQPRTSSDPSDNGAEEIACVVAGCPEFTDRLGWRAWSWPGVGCQFFRASRVQAVGKMETFRPGRMPAPFGSLESAICNVQSVLPPTPARAKAASAASGRRSPLVPSEWLTGTVELGDYSSAPPDDSGPLSSICSSDSLRLWVFDASHGVSWAEPVEAIPVVA